MYMIVGKFVAVSLLIVLNLASPAFSQQTVEDSGAMTNRQTTALSKDFLVSITPPVVGYSSIEGTIYNATPISVELAVHDRIGLRFNPAVIYYESHVQAYYLLASMPFYFKQSDEQTPYHGLFIGPALAGMVDRLPVRHRAVRAGFEIGYSWFLKKEMQFLLGYWHVGKSLDFEVGDAGLTISLGYWF
jgi:hypothetical protein